MSSRFTFYSAPAERNVEAIFRATFATPLWSWIYKNVFMGECISYAEVELCEEQLNSFKEHLAHVTQADCEDSQVWEDVQEALAWVKQILKSFDFKTRRLTVLLAV